MKRLGLGLVVVLMAGTMARADDRLYEDIVTRVEESPTGRIVIAVGEDRHPKAQKPQLEQRLKAIEQKLDRILKELEDMKGQRQAGRQGASYFDFAIGAFY